MHNPTLEFGMLRSRQHLHRNMPTSTQRHWAVPVKYQFNIPKCVSCVCERIYLYSIYLNRFYIKQSYRIREVCCNSSTVLADLKPINFPLQEGEGSDMKARIGRVWLFL